MYFPEIICLESQKDTDVCSFGKSKLKILLHKYHWNSPEYSEETHLFYKDVLTT